MSLNAGVVQAATVPPERVLTIKGMTFQSGVFAWHPRRDLLAMGRRLVNLSHGLSAYREDEAATELKFPESWKEAPIVRCVAWNADGSELAIGGSDCLVHVWAVDAPHRPRVTLPQCSEPRKNAITALKWWSPASSGPGGGGGSGGMASSGGGQDLLLAAVDSKTVVWDAAGERLVRESEHHTGSVCDMDWCGDMYASCCSSDKMIHLHRVPPRNSSGAGGDMASGSGGEGGGGGGGHHHHHHQPVLGLTSPDVKLAGHTAGVNTVRWCPDQPNGLLASGSHDGDVRLWAVNRSVDLTESACQVLHVMKGHSRAVRAVVWCPGPPTLVASGSSDGTVCLWDVERGVCRSELNNHHARGIYAVAVSPDGRLVASVSEDKTVAIWSVTEARLVYVHREQQFPMLNVRWHPRSGSGFVAADNRFELVVFDIPPFR